MSGHLLHTRYSNTFHFPLRPQTGRFSCFYNQVQVSEIWEPEGSDCSDVTPCILVIYIETKKNTVASCPILSISPCLIVVPTIRSCIYPTFNTASLNIQQGTRQYPQHLSRKEILAQKASTYILVPLKEDYIFPRILLGRTNKSTIPTVVCILLLVLVARKIRGT
jgi:hypothetical protein